ncbi:MAG: hypothetical protein J6W64_08885 [Bacilli bacterium]|nr:hypothetical protein [Bacilli bacterium]
MFDIKILGYSFYHEYVDNIYPVVEMEARHEDDFLCMPIKIKRIYDAYDFVYNKLDGTLDDMIKDFVDELWKEFHKGIPKVYEISLYISLPVGLNMWIKEHIRNEIEKRLAIKRDEDKLCRELSNSRFGIISHDMRHMYPVPIIPNRDIRTLFPETLYKDTDLADSIIDTLRYGQYDINMVLNQMKDRARAKEKIKEYEKMHIENVIFNDPATIVFWRDGSKTVVKAKDEPFDKEKGLAMAIAKKVYGNEGNYYNIFRKWCKED